MNYEIVTDSSANLTDDIIDKYGLHIITLFYNIEGKEYKSYVKGVKNNLDDFYLNLRRKINITTSAMNAEVCRNVCEDILKEGKDLIYMGFSSALSLSYEVANGVINELKAKYPERKIYSVDTLAASMGEGLMVTYAAKLREEGKSIEELYQWVLDHRLNFCHYFTVNDLFFLKRGGRVSTAKYILASVLDMKPILHTDDNGKLIPIDKVRGRKASIKALLANMEKTIVNPDNQTVYIAHADCENDANDLAIMIKEKFNITDIVINFIEPVIGSHSGPGTLALFFYGAHR